LKQSNRGEALCSLTWLVNTHDIRFINKPGTMKWSVLHICWGDVAVYETTGGKWALLGIGDYALAARIEVQHYG